MTDWTVSIDARGRSGSENMALDDALLDDAVRSGGALLRLYRWDPPTLSVGRNQVLTFNGIPVVRRPTGGQAVWHEHEVTYAVAAPIAVFGSLRNAYCEIHGRLARAFRTLGLETKLAPVVRRSSRPASCFAAATGGEILVDGRKLVGSAQVRRGEAFLQHGSILLDGTQAIVGPATNATTLGAELRRTVTFEEVTAAIVANWGETVRRCISRPAVKC